jgi:hypothetical protein
VDASELGATAERLFRGFMAPLVLGGALTPGRPIGARAALALGHERTAADPDLAAHVQLARVRVARRLVPIDRLDPASEVEWSLAAALHDIVQATHPGFDAALRRSAPEKLLAMATSVIERVPPPRNVRDALSRHTWFARLFDAARTDTHVSWWVGSQKFYGETPPRRFVTWPDLRRVHVERTPRALLDLPAHGGAVDAQRFEAALARFVVRTPLTDIATSHREAPMFAWHKETIGLIATPTGRTLALRALARAPSRAVDTAIGRATKEFLSHAGPRAAAPCLDLLGERILAHVLTAPKGVWGQAPNVTTEPFDAGGAFARAAGAIVARQRLRSVSSDIPPEARKRALKTLESYTASAQAREAEALLTSAGLHLP